MPNPNSPFVSMTGVSKSFGTKTIVDNVSLTVMPGEIFGLLGPNGAGKTTTLRLMLDLLEPDAGQVRIFGGTLDSAKRDRIGYMPEERGLYNTMRVRECLIYLASLKNLSARHAQARVDEALRRFELWEHRQKKTSELSRGLAQKAQLIAATVHDPDLLIVDEPFANLDPLNIQLVQDLLREQRTRGKAVILSSHQLPLVESLCDRVLLMHRGKVMLEGTLPGIQRERRENVVRMRGQADWATLPHVVGIQERGGVFHVFLANDIQPSDWLREIMKRSDIVIEEFEPVFPSLDEIFRRIVQDPPADPA